MGKQSWADQSTRQALTEKTVNNISRPTAVEHFEKMHRLYEPGYTPQSTSPTQDKMHEPCPNYAAEYLDEPGYNPLIQHLTQSYPSTAADFNEIVRDLTDKPTTREALEKENIRVCDRRRLTTCQRLAAMENRSGR